MCTFHMFANYHRLLISCSPYLQVSHLDKQNIFFRAKETCIWSSDTVPIRLPLAPQRRYSQTLYVLSEAQRLLKHHIKSRISVEQRRWIVVQISLSDTAASILPPGMKLARKQSPVFLSVRLSSAAQRRAPSDLLLHYAPTNQIN